MREIDADAEIQKSAQELEISEEEFKVRFRGQVWVSQNPYIWPADWPDRMNNGDIWGVLRIAFGDEQANEMYELDPPVSLLEALGVLNAIQKPIGQNLGKLQRSGRSFAPTRNTSKPTSKRTTKSTSSTTTEAV